MNVRPTGNRVVIEPAALRDVSSGGIHLVKGDSSILAVYEGG